MYGTYSTNSLDECDTVDIRILNIINAKYNTLFAEKYNYASEWHGKTCTSSYLVHITVNWHSLTHINNFSVIWLDFSLSLLLSIIIITIIHYHPTYGHDLAPLYFYLFTPLKTYFEDKRFFDDEDIHVTVDKWMKT